MVDLGLKKLVFSIPVFNHHCRMINALATAPVRFVASAMDPGKDVSICVSFVQAFLIISLI